MNNFTSLETILIIYILAVNVLGFIAIIITPCAPKKASDIIFYIFFGVALPFVLPAYVYIIFKEIRKELKRKENEK